MRSIAFLRDSKVTQIVRISAAETKNTQVFHYLVVLTPLILSAFTHIWNPLGFPTIRTDEGIYMERALRILQGGGPQVPIEDFGRPYDHPYFSQIFLASILGSIGYPDSVRNSTDVYSPELLYLIPRIIMGIIAVASTFIIYKICERRYNERVAFAAAVLFAVMPLSWLTRRLYIDPIQLPFILLAILFAVYMTKRDKNITPNLNPLALLSGIFLGLSIFTKIPAICMIPLVGYLVFKGASNDKNKNSLTILVLWLVPVILIPSIWPAFAILNGQFDSWYGDVLWQAGRVGGISDTFRSILEMDPILVLMGLAGAVYVTIFKRDLFVFIWIIPFVIFFSFFIGRMAITFWVMMLPAFCIAAGILIADLTKHLENRVKASEIQYKSRISYYLEDKSKPFRERISALVLNRRVLVFPIVLTTITVIGLVSTILLITTDLNSTYFELYRFIISHMSESENSPNDSNVLLVGSAKLRSFSWIPKYVMRGEADNFDYRASPLRESFQNKSVILLSDKGDIDRFINSNPKDYVEHKNLYNSTHQIGEFMDKTIAYDRDNYPYTNMIENRGMGEIVVRVN